MHSFCDVPRGGGGYRLCGSQAFIESIPQDGIRAIYDENVRMA